jgi:hypothetical protein
MLTYSAMQNRIEDEIRRLGADKFSTKWGLEDLYRLALRGSIAQTQYIDLNFDKLIKYCLRKPRSYDGLREYINKRVQ